MLYLHGVDQLKTGCHFDRNLRLFNEIFGDEMLEFVTIVSTKWDKVDLKDSTRKAMMLNDESFFKTLINGGAEHRKHDGRRENAQEIVRQTLLKPTILQREIYRLRIQEEMVDCKLNLGDTSAMAEVNHSYRIVIARLNRDLSHKQGERGRVNRSGGDTSNMDKPIEKLRERIVYLESREKAQSPGSKSFFGLLRSILPF